MYFLGTLIIIGVQVAVSMLVLAFAPSLLDNPNLSLLVSMLPTCHSLSADQSVDPTGTRCADEKA